MSVPIRALAATISLTVVAVACSGGGDDEAAPSTTSSTTTTTAEVATTSSTTTSTTTTSTTVAESTTSSTEPEGPTTPPDVLAADGISSAEDAAVFVVTSWIAVDRDAASRHAETAAIDALFGSPAPAADAIELIECDTADLERYDCFFTADGTIIIIGVDGLRVIEASIDSD